MIGQAKHRDNLHPECALKFACLFFLIGVCLMCACSCGKSFKTSTEYLISGNEYFKMGDYANAEKSYREALAKAPANAIAKNNLGVILNEEGKYKEAIDMLNEAVKADPKNAIAHYVLANALLNAGDPDKALEEATLATELDKTDARGFYIQAKSAM